MEKKSSILQCFERFKSLALTSSLKLEQIELFELGDVLATGVRDVLSNQIKFRVSLNHRNDLSLQAVMHVVHWVDLHLSV